MWFSVPVLLLGVCVLEVSGPGKCSTLSQVARSREALIGEDCVPLRDSGL